MKIEAESKEIPPFIANFGSEEPKKPKIVKFTPDDLKKGKLAKKSIDLIYIKKLDSFVVLSNCNSYVKGKAIKFIIQNLKTLSFYKWVLFIPNPILDLAYSFIGKIRYKVFGKSKNCLYLNKKLKNRFII